jgi:hypothetical protein
MIDFTVIIAGPERHDGEEPYVYVVRDEGSAAASEAEVTHFKAEQGTDDVVVLSVESGVPSSTCGYAWNDIRA